MTKQLKMSLLFAVLFLAAFGSACTKVPPGWVGIKVNNYGSQKGVDDFPLRTGRVWFNPFSTDVYKFPTFAQTTVWTQSRTEGSKDDDSITFADSKGVTFNADVALTYLIKRERVPYVFVKFRQPVEELTNVYMRNKVREAFNTVGSQYEAMQIVGEKKAEFQVRVKEELNRMLADDGIVFDTVSMVGAPRVPDKVQRAINDALEATQRAIKAENEVRERQAIAAQKVADAEGEAKSITVRAKAQADANRILAASVTPELIRYEIAHRWNGTLPLMTGGAVPLIDVGPISKLTSSAPSAAGRRMKRTSNASVTPESSEVKELREKQDQLEQKIAAVGEDSAAGKQLAAALDEVMKRLSPLLD